MRAALTLAAALACAAPASAAAPVHVAPYPSDNGVVAVAQDGTVLAATGARRGALYATVGTHTLILRSAVEFPRPLVAGGGDDLALAYAAHGHVHVRLASAAGFRGPADIGSGSLLALVGNRRGDMAALVTEAGRLELSYRRAGGAFGAATEVPGLGVFADQLGRDVSLAIGPSGDALVGVAGDQVRVVSRAPGGAYSAPVALPGTEAGAYGENSFTAPRLAVAAGGRAIALWGNVDPNSRGIALDGAVRQPDGRWLGLSGLDAQGYASGTDAAVATDDAGDAVLAWNETSGNAAVHATTASLATGQAEPSFALPIDGLPAVAEAADGSATIAAAVYPHVQVVRRAATGAFGAAEDVGCGSAAINGGLDAQGHSVIGFYDQPPSNRFTTVTDGASAGCSDLYPAEDALEVQPPRPAPGERVTLRALPSQSATVGATAWDLDELPGFETHTAGPVVHHRFGAGFHKLFVDETLHGPDGTTADAVTIPMLLFVPAAVRLRAPSQRATAIPVHGLHVRVRAATTSSVGARVRLVVPNQYHTLVLAQRTVTLRRRSRHVRLDVPGYPAPGTTLTVLAVAANDPEEETYESGKHILGFVHVAVT